MILPDKVIILNFVLKGLFLMINYYMGGDVSKGFTDFVIIDQNKKIIENNFRLDDTFDGHHKLFEILKTFLTKHPESIVYSAVESTGGYENNWYNSLHKFQKDLSIKVSRLNPVGVHHNSKAEMKRVTTDKISAMSIAEYLIDHSDKVSYEQADYFSSLRRQWRFTQLLIKQRTQLYNELESVVYNANPEVLVYCKDGVPQWVLKLLQQYPTAKSLSRAKLTTLAKIPYITREKAESLIANAKRSVASSTDSITAELVVSIVSQIMHHIAVINNQEKFMLANCRVPELELLQSFNGIGISSAVGLLIEIGAVERFEDVKHLASYFGLHPVYKQSGDNTWGMHMSKQGRIAPRYILYNVAFSAMTCNPLIKDLYAYYIKKGFKHRAVLGIMMHKILRIIYGMLKNNEKFNPEIDKHNREKQAKAKPKTISEDKSRRYQSNDSNAPISGRQNKKRKELMLPQDEITSSNAGSDTLSFQDNNLIKS